jgi:hypothetical protein
MGDKQRQKIATLAQHETSCEGPAHDIKTAIAAILVINQQILAAMGNHVLKHQLEATKNPHFGTINVARVKLNKIFPLYQASITDLENFIKKKEGRLLFKSTLDQAKTALGHYKDQLKDYKDLVASSVYID